MISTWSEWKRYPRAGRGENLEAPITPGIYEVRFAATGALHSFGAVDNVAQALALLPSASKSWFSRRAAAETPDLEYRTCATSTKADAKAAADRMIGRRETYLSGAAAAGRSSPLTIAATWRMAVLQFARCSRAFAGGALRAVSGYNRLQ